MSYRDAGASLRAHRERVASDLAAARRASEEALEWGKQVNALEKELAQTDKLLASMTGRRTLPLLDNLQIATPCNSDWDEMIGDARVRFCTQCEKNVYNLSAMPREEAQAFLVQREGTVCVRLYKRQDGTVLTNDCPVGVRTRHRRRAAVAGLGGGLMAAAAAVGLRSTVVMGEYPHPTMGAVAVMGDVSAHPESTARPEPTPSETATPEPIPAGTVAPPPGGHWMMGAPPPLAPQPPRPEKARR
jgi:hypothetical protein